MDERRTPPARPDERVGRAVERGRVSEPLHQGEAELREAMAARGGGDVWRPAAAPGEWEAHSDSGDKRALIKTVADDYQVSVYRHPTGPTPGPDPELAHGPQVFSRPEDALDYAEAQLGS